MMRHDKRKIEKGSGQQSHETDALFTEWPTASDVVRAFGGNQNDADHKQWNTKKP